MNRKELAQKKIDEWLAGVSEEGFSAALEALVEAKGGRMEVVSRLDEYGNADANLGEVTVVVRHKGKKECPPPNFRPLTEVVEAVAKHQAAGFSPSTTQSMIPQSVPAVNEAPVAKATKRILHVVPGLNEPWNGISGAAKDIAKSQGADIVDTRQFLSSSSHSNSELPLSSYDEIWVHSNWWWLTIKACRKVLKAGVPLVRMTHANLDPLRYYSKWFKKVLVSPLERWIYKRTSRVVVTCDEERAWCEQWGVKGPFEILDLKQFYRLEGIGKEVGDMSLSGTKDDKDSSLPLQLPIPTQLNVLYLGRPHPLKGVKYLELAVADLNDKAKSLVPGCDKGCIDLKIVSNTYGEELEKIWQWTDVLVLPTLSENFGRVVAEALEHGKPVITTDGAPAWRTYFEQHPDAGIYLKGYRDGSEEKRVRMLAEALKAFVE